MRDPERIDPFLQKLAEFWKMVPDWRFGQLIMNLSRNNDGSFPDTWQWEETDWEEKIAAWSSHPPKEPTEEEIEERVEEIMKKLDKIEEIHKRIRFE